MMSELNNEEYSKEQIEDLADVELKKHQEQVNQEQPFSFDLNIGEKQYQVYYEKDEEGTWKLQDYKIKSA